MDVERINIINNNNNCSKNKLSNFPFFSLVYFPENTHRWNHWFMIHFSTVNALTIRFIVQIYPSMVNSSISIFWYFPIAEQRKCSWRVFWCMKSALLENHSSNRIGHEIVPHPFKWPLANLICSLLKSLLKANVGQHSFFIHEFSFFFSSACAFVRVLFKRWKSTELFRRCINNNDVFTA